MHGYKILNCTSGTVCVRPELSISKLKKKKKAKSNDLNARLMEAYAVYSGNVSHKHLPRKTLPKVHVRHRKGMGQCASPRAEGSQNWITSTRKESNFAAVDCDVSRCSYLQGQGTAKYWLKKERSMLKDILNHWRTSKLSQSTVHSAVTQPQRMVSSPHPHHGLGQEKRNRTIAFGLRIFIYWSRHYFNCCYTFKIRTKWHSVFYVHFPQTNYREQNDVW